MMPRLGLVLTKSAHAMTMPLIVRSLASSGAYADLRRTGAMPAVLIPVNCTFLPVVQARLGSRCEHWRRNKILSPGRLGSPASFTTRATATETTTALAATGAAAAASTPCDGRNVETVLLEVGDMKCGGCSAAVKRMLLTRPEVAAAAVNLLTETAVVQVRGSAAELGPSLASFVTTRGFPSRLRSGAAEGDDPLSAAATDEAERKRQAEARRSLIDLGVAWLLVAACCVHHAGHLLHALGYHEVAHAPLLAALADPRVSGALGAFALLGPGRRLLVSGFKALLAGNPNMES
ncbi:hypothetical protein VaNZ11_016656, partial [Volvox africanus]